MKYLFQTLAAAFATAAISGVNSGAQAADQFIDEARFGGALIDARYTGREQPYYNYWQAAANAELLFSPFNFDYREEADDGFVHQILTPRLHVGATVALVENATSSIYTGLTWHYDLGQIFFVEASFGGAVHNGELSKKSFSATKIRRDMGSRVLFRESIAVGASITESLNVVLQFSHMSNAGLAGDENAGQSDVALKLGWEF